MCPILQNLPFKYSAHWKQQGITYLQYLGLNTKAVRGCLKVVILDYHYQNLSSRTKLSLSLIAAVNFKFTIQNCVSLENQINSENYAHRNPWQENPPLALLSTTTELTKMEKEVIFSEFNEHFILTSNPCYSEF